MIDDDLTDSERALFLTLPQPPKTVEIRASNVWIIEWLSADEANTGKDLHDWMKRRQEDWSVHLPCKSKAGVFAAIARAAKHAQNTDMFPVLHLEAHGGDAGLEGPDDKGGRELLAWDELTEPLQGLNLATRCNLVVVVAACIGIAGIQIFSRGPRAPAVALVGPDASVMPSNLLLGAKEFYRRWLDVNPRLSDIVASASNEAGTVAFEYEPFAALAHEALVEPLIKYIRPAERLRRIERFRQRFLATATFSESEIERRLDTLPLAWPWDELQRQWDEMFMIDLYPSNQERFGLDWKEIVERIAASVVS